MRTFCSVVGALAASVRGPGQLQGAKRGTIRRVFDRDPLVRPHPLLFQEFAHELTSSTLIPPGLDQHVEDLTFPIDSPPEIHLLATNADRHLVEVPTAV